MFYINSNIPMEVIITDVLVPGHLVSFIRQVGYLLRVELEIGHPSNPPCTVLLGVPL